MGNSRRTPHDAQEMIRSKGLRATAARIKVLNVLLSAEHTMTHAEIEEAIDSSAGDIERVTLYRVLEWLVKQELAHKVVGADRVWRFNALRHSEPRHAHFSCTHCGKVFCLETLSPVFAFTLPDGFHLQKAEVSLQGLCPQCSH